MKYSVSYSVLLVCCLVSTVTLAGSPILPGDRIAIVGNTFADQLRIHGYLEYRLLQSTPENPVSIRNLGWGGDMLTARDRPTNFPSEESTLAKHKTDVIVACFGLGESFAGEQQIEKFRAELRAFIASHAGKKYNGKSPVRLILVSPIAYEDLGELTPSQEKRNRELRAYSRAMQDVAANEDLPFVNLFATSQYLMNERQGPDLTSNGIHLNGHGYWAISQTLHRELTAGDRFEYHEPWQLTVNLKSNVSTARGVDISHVRTEGDGVRFLVTEKSAASLPPPTDQPLPPQLEFSRDTLRVEGLSPGTYQLKVDEEPVVTATAEAWAEGIAVDSSPAHREAEAFRAAINDKNLQFTYGWKALNQVHIVGERKSSPSGKALPQELIEFDKLADERDAALQTGFQPKTRRWLLTPVTK